MGIKLISSAELLRRDQSCSEMQPGGARAVGSRDAGPGEGTWSGAGTGSSRGSSMQTMASPPCPQEFLGPGGLTARAGSSQLRAGQWDQGSGDLECQEP